MKGDICLDIPGKVAKGHKITLLEVISEVKYYTGKSIGTQEAEEIRYFVENNNAPISEVICEYYGC